MLLQTATRLSILALLCLPAGCAGNLGLREYENEHESEVHLSSRGTCTWESQRGTEGYMDAKRGAAARERDEWLRRQRIREPF